MLEELRRWKALIQTTVPRQHLAIRVISLVTGARKLSSVLPITTSASIPPPNQPSGVTTLCGTIISIAMVWYGSHVATISHLMHPTSSASWKASPLLLHHSPLQVVKRLALLSLSHWMASMLFSLLLAMPQ